MLNFLKGFVYALNGWMFFFKNERNGKVQLFVGIVAVSLGIWLHISEREWIMVLACIAAVLSSEMVNSAIERLCNLVQSEYHPEIKKIKDMAAGAVLWVSVFSAIIGTIIFLPKILVLLGN